MMLFGLHAGALADMLDRRLLVMLVDLMRAGVLLVLAALIVAGAAPIGVVLGALFLLGTAEAFADSSSITLLPMLVHRDDLAIGNARLQTGFLTLNQLAGPPIGAALFAAGAAWPFLGQTVLVVAGAGLISKVALPAHGRTDEPTRTMRHDIGEGLRWVRH